MRRHAELERLRAAAQLVQRLDVGTHRVLHRAGVLADQLGGRLLGADDRADGQVFDDFLEIDAVDLGEQLGPRMAPRVQREQDVFLIHTGQRDERLAAGQAFLLEQVAVGAVAVDDRRARQQLAQELTPLEPVFNDLDRNAGRQEHFRQEIGDFAAADQHRRADAVVRHADLLEKLRLLARRDDDRDIVAGHEDKIALGDVSLPAAAHHAQQHVGAQPGVDLADRHAVQPRALRDADIQQLNAALGKGAYADGRGEADQAGNHAGGGQLGIDDHREPQLVADEADLGYIFRVAHARDGVAPGRPARDQAG